MNLIAIGQRLMDIRHDDPSVFDQLTRPNEVIGLRHRLAHDYEEINFDLVWTFVEDHLPLLLKEAAELRDRFVDEYKVQLD